MLGSRQALPGWAGEGSLRQAQGRLCPYVNEGLSLRDLESTTT
jgi:hypothetical protein